MSTTIDPHNTTQWQQTGNTIFLLEENGRSTANAFSVTVDKYHPSNNQTDPKEIASKICSFLNNESVGVDPKVRLEIVFQSIVNICSDATRGNAAFEPKYGLHILNDIRRELDLDIVNTGNEQQDIKKMEELLGRF